MRKNRSADQKLAGEQGAVVVLLAIFVFTLLLLIGAQFAIGIVSVGDHELQRNADAAALTAAAATLTYRPAGDTTVVEQHITNLNDDNTILGESANVTLSNLTPITRTGMAGYAVAGTTADTDGFLVELSAPVAYPFLPEFLGADSTVTAKAAVVVGSPRCATPTLPIIALDCRVDGLFTPNDLCNAPLGAPVTGKFAPDDVQNIAWFDFAFPVNADDVRDMINGTVTIPELCVGTYIHLLNGVCNSCLQELEAECLGEPDPDDDECTVANPKEFIIPIVSCADLQNQGGQPNQPIPISGFLKIDVFATNPNPDHRLDFQRIEGVLDGSGGGLDCGLVSTRPVLIQ